MEWFWQQSGASGTSSPSSASAAPAPDDVSGATSPAGATSPGERQATPLSRSGSPREMMSGTFGSASAAAVLGLGELNDVMGSINEAGANVLGDVMGSINEAGGAIGDAGRVLGSLVTMVGATSVVLNESQARVSAEGHNSWRDYKKDWILGTGEGKLFAFGMVFVVLLIGGSLAWMSIDHGGEEDLGVDWNFEQSIWWSWSLLFDPGTHTGLPANAPFLTHAVAWVFSVLGFFFLLVILGIVVDLVRAALDYGNEVCSRVVENNHTLILGWGNRAIYLLQELLAAYNEDRNKVAGCCGRRRSKRIIILAEKPQFDVLQEINMHFLKADDSDAKRTRSLIQYREGDPTDWKELEKVSASSADDILILRTNGTPQASDNHALQCCLALSALSSDQAVTGEVFAEVQNPKILGMVTACNASGVVLRRTAVRMLCHQCLYPAVGEALQEIISFTANHVYLVANIPDELRTKTLMQASMYYPNAVLIGTRTSTECHSQKSLVFISQGEPKLKKPRRHPDGSRLSRTTTWSTSTLSSVRQRRVDAQKRAEAAAGESPIHRSTSGDGSEAVRSNSPSRSPARSEFSRGVSPHGPSSSEPASPTFHITTSRPSESSTSSPHMGPVMTRPESPRHTWHRNVVQQTGRSVVVMIGSPSDIQIHVWSLQNLTQQPLDLHILTTHPESFTNKVPVDPAKGSVKWYVGDSTDEQDIQRLPLKEAACILVMAFKLDEDEPAAPTDARSLSTVFQLREMLRHQLAEDEEPPKIVCELMDIRSKLVVETGAFKGTASFFHSVRVETALFATAADDTQVFNMLMLLVEPNGMDLCVATAGQLGIFDAPEVEARSTAGGASVASSGFQPTGTTGTVDSSVTVDATREGECSEADWKMEDFWTLQNKITSKDPESILIGWRRHPAEDESASDAREWEVNPQQKESKFKVTRDTQLAILKCKAPDKRVMPSLARTSAKTNESDQGSKKSTSTLPVVAGVFEVPLCL